MYILLFRAFPHIRRKYQDFKSPECSVHSINGKSS